MSSGALSRGTRAVRWAAFVVSAVVAAAACAREPRPEPTEQEHAAARQALVDHSIAPAIQDSAVVAAMRKVPRHLFVPPDLRILAYEDRPLPIGEGQTISQPYIVALMTALLEPRPGMRVLEVGTGSGYQAAVLAEVGAEVYSIEILPGVARQGAANLAAAGYEGVHLRTGDGYRGWSEAAPFRGILVTCAPDHIPGPLQEQLAEGGRLVIPVGEEGGVQELVVVTREGDRLIRQSVIPVRFVPMTGPGVRR